MNSAFGKESIGSTDRDVYCMFAYYFPTLNKGHLILYRTHMLWYSALSFDTVTLDFFAGKKKLNEKKKTSSSVGARSIKACVQ